MRVRETKKLAEVPIVLHLAGQIMAVRINKIEFAPGHKENIQIAALEALQIAAILLQTYNEEEMK